MHARQVVACLTHVVCLFYYWETTADLCNLTKLQGAQDIFEVSNFDSKLIWVKAAWHVCLFALESQQTKGLLKEVVVVVVKMFIGKPQQAFKASLQGARGIS